MWIEEGPEGRAKGQEEVLADWRRTALEIVLVCLCVLLAIAFFVTLRKLDVANVQLTAFASAAGYTAPHGGPAPQAPGLPTGVSPTIHGSGEIEYGPSRKAEAGNQRTIGTSGRKTAPPTRRGSADHGKPAGVLPMGGVSPEDGSAIVSGAQDVASGPAEHREVPPAASGRSLADTGWIPDSNDLGGGCEFSVYPVGGRPFARIDWWGKVRGPWGETKRGPELVRTLDLWAEPGLSPGASGSFYGLLDLTSAPGIQAGVVVLPKGTRWGAFGAVEQRTDKRVYSLGAVYRFWP